MLMAGGTGGHLFPAMALAQELRRRGHAIHLMTDERVAGYGDDFPAEATHIVPSATPSIRNPAKLALAGARILEGTGVAFGKLGGIKADAMVGFGGYPTVPSFIAGRLRRIPGVVHDQNAVLGRANLLRARYANALASDWFCMYPLFGSTQHYRLQHIAHHQFVNDPDRDPDVSPVSMGTLLLPKVNRS